MPKPLLIPEQSLLEHELIETMLAGHKSWRSDLAYPESHSDMAACARAVMVMFDVKRRALPSKLYSPCSSCGGTGYIATDEHARRSCTAQHCKHGKIEVEP